jgi:hypothetical protein
MMSTAASHYQNLLASRYIWMLGDDLESKLRLAARLAA